MIIKYSRIHDDVKEPQRANPSDAGLDVFWCPDKNTGPVKIIQPGENKLLGTGLKFEVPHGYMLEVKNRSSMAAKKRLVVGACVVDPNYEGEVFIDLHNIGVDDEYLEKGDKIAQLVLVPVVHFRAEEVEEGELYKDQIAMSNRGDGALGSTDE